MNVKSLVLSLISILLCGLFGAGCTSAGTNIRDMPAATSRDKNPRVQILRVSTGSDGKIASVVVVQSSGSTLADQKSIDYVKAHMYGPPNSQKDIAFYLSRDLHQSLTTRSSEPPLRSGR